MRKFNTVKANSMFVKSEKKVLNILSSIEATGHGVSYLQIEIIDYLGYLFHKIAFIIQNSFRQTSIISYNSN